MSPPRKLITSIGPLPGGRQARRAYRAEHRSDRRNVIVQCSKCGANATATTEDGTIVASNLNLVRGPKRLTHFECGGIVIAADIAVMA